MKIIAMSDSHGDTRAVKKVLENNPDADIVLYAGDGLRDIRRLVGDDSKFILYCVKGNCDGDDSTPDEEIVDAGGVRILLTHGDRLYVKYKLNDLAEHAKEAGVALTVFGHTHKPLVINKHGAFMLNPGTVSRSHSYGAATYAVIKVENGDITAAKIEMLE